MIFYARLNNEEYIDGFSDTENEVYNTAFEVEEDDIDELSACSGQCFKIENGIAVRKKDVTEYLLEWETKKKNAKRIKMLKNLLAETDYKAIKFAEGLISPEEYETIRQERQTWREEINLLGG